MTQEGPAAEPSSPLPGETPSAGVSGPPDPSGAVSGPNPAQVAEILGWLHDPTDERDAGELRSALRDMGDGVQIEGPPAKPGPKPVDRPTNPHEAHYRWWASLTRAKAQWLSDHGLLEEFWEASADARYAMRARAEVKRAERLARTGRAA